MRNFSNHRCEREYGNSIPIKKRYIIPLLLFITFVSGAQEFVLKVGNTSYTDIDIKAKFDSGFFSYEKLVLDLAREEAIINLKKDNPRLHKSFIDLRVKGAKNKTSDPAEMKMHSSTLNLMLDTWLDQKAIRIPVLYLDIKKILEIASESGLSISIPYTYAELQVTGQTDLVSVKGKPYLAAAEYNEYIKENYYRRIIRYALREIPVNKVRNLLIRMIAAEKLSTEGVDLKNMKMDEVDIESHVSRYINEQMFSDDRSVGYAEYETPTDMMEGIYVAYSNNHKDELDRLRNLLQGKAAAVKDSYGMRFFIRSIKLDIVKPTLIRRPTGERIDEWIKTTQYKGPVNEAEWIMMEEECTAIIEQYSATKEIKVYPF
jgi:hypothetical protein